MTSTVRCLDCHGDYIAPTEQGGYCGRCGDFVFIYLDLSRPSC